MKKRKSRKRPFFFPIKILTGLFLLAVSIVMAHTLVTVCRQNSMALWEEMNFFLAGFGAYFLLHIYLRKKPLVYVFAHELTHILFVWIFHGWARGLKIKKSGGSVYANKDNILISLAPYFFPFYTFLLLAIYTILLAFVKNYLIFTIFKTIIGLSGGFHVLFTAEMLLTQQDDFKAAGKFLSLMMIIFCNLAIFSLIFLMLSETVTAELYFSIFKRDKDIWLFYLHILPKGDKIT